MKTIKFISAVLRLKSISRDIDKAKVGGMIQRFPAKVIFLMLTETIAREEILRKIDNSHEENENIEWHK